MHTTLTVYRPRPGSSKRKPSSSSNTISPACTLSSKSANNMIIKQSISLRLLVHPGHPTKENVVKDFKKDNDKHVACPSN